MTRGLGAVVVAALGALGVMEQVLLLDGLDLGLELALNVLFLVLLLHLGLLGVLLGGGHLVLLRQG